MAVTAANASGGPHPGPPFADGGGVWPAFNDRDGQALEFLAWICTVRSFSTQWIWHL